MTTLGRRKNDAIDALAKLAGGMDGKSETAKIREVIDSVELALLSGVNRKKVFDTLKESLGIKMNFKTFETALHRIRKERKLKKIPSNNSNSIQIESPNTGNQIIQYSNSQSKNTDLILISSECDDNISPENEKEDDGYEYKDSKLTQLQHMRKLKEPLDYEALNEAARKYREEQKEKQKREREQAKLKKQLNY
jgi:hypothetical protein